MSHPDLKAEQVVLLQILNAYIHAEKDDTLPPDFFSFEPLFALSHAQGVAPVVWHALSSDQRALRDCPAALAALWRADSDRESAAQAQREAQFLDLYQLLRESGLHPLVLKGAVCRSLYAWPTLRASCDEDILLQKDEFEEFDILIRACGFFRDEKQSHAVSYTEPESALHVDVSFEPFRSYHAFNRKQNAAFRDVFDRAEELDISGTKVLTPEPTKNLLFLILHHLKHFCSGGAGLRMLCDIVAFTERFSGRIDRDRLCRTLRDFGLERYVGALEAIGRRYLGLPPEDAILPGSADGARDVRDLLDDMFAAGSHGTLSHTRVQSARITLAALDDGAGRGSVWKTCFSRRAEECLQNTAGRRAGPFCCLPLTLPGSQASCSASRGAGCTAAAKTPMRNGSLWESGGWTCCKNTAFWTPCPTVPRKQTIQGVIRFDGCTSFFS